MKNKIYTRSVTIRDNDMNRWGITFEVREVDPCTKRNIDTLEEFVEHFEVSVCAEGCGSWGQCYGRITPRTPGQKDLLDFWNKYHCGSIASGTRAQEKYLHGEQYKKRLCQNADTAFFYAQSPDFLKPGLCYYPKFSYL